MRRHIVLFSCFIACSLAPAAHAAVDCFLPIACNAYPQQYDPSNLIVRCRHGAYPQENPLSEYHEVKICTAERNQAGLSSQAGHVLVRVDGHAYPCGTQTMYPSYDAFKVQDLPVQNQNANVTITIGGVSVTIPVELDRYCSVYQPSLTGAPIDAGRCGGDSVHVFKCREP